jgi:hypothetical protein
MSRDEVRVPIPSDSAVGNVEIEIRGVDEASGGESDGRKVRPSLGNGPVVDHLASLPEQQEIIELQEGLDAGLVDHRGDGDSPAHGDVFELPSKDR